MPKQTHVLTITRRDGTQLYPWNPSPSTTVAVCGNHALLKRLEEVLGRLDQVTVDFRPVGWLNHIREVWWRSGAQSEYFARDKKAGQYWDILETSADPEERWKALSHLARLRREMAAAQLRGWGPKPMNDEGGRDLAESLYSSSLLLDLLADVEHTIAYKLDQDDVFKHKAGDRLLDAAVPVLRQMIAADYEQRVKLLDVLYDAVYPVVGGQAAEVVACVPAPGRVYRS